MSNTQNLNGAGWLMLTEEEKMQYRFPDAPIIPPSVLVFDDEELAIAADFERRLLSGLRRERWRSIRRGAVKGAVLMLILIAAAAIVVTYANHAHAFDAAKVVRDAGADYGSQPPPPAQPTAPTSVVCRPDKIDPEKLVCEVR